MRGKRYGLLRASVASVLESSVASILGRLQNDKVATITIENVGSIDGNGDFPISYLIDIDDSAVQFWAYPSSEPDPTTVVQLLSAPFIYQGTTAMTVGGSNILLNTSEGLSGSVKFALLPSNGSDNDLVLFGPITIPSLGLTLITRQQSSSTFSSQQNFTIDAQSGDNLVFVVCSSAAHLINSAVIDPGGPNQTSINIRLQSSGINSTYGFLGDAVWPTTGSLNVRFTFASGVASISMTAFSAGTLTYQNSVYVESPSVSPENHTGQINTAAGQHVVMSAVINTAVTPVITSGVDTQVGDVHVHGTRRSYVWQKNSVAGGTPETFRIDWPSVNFVPSGGILGVYGE